jgi:hypothetical protein
MALWPYALCDGNMYVYNPITTNMSLVLSANPTITTYVGNKLTGEQLVVIRKGDGGDLGPAPPTLKFPQPSGKHTTRVSQNVIQSYNVIERMLSSY